MEQALITFIDKINAFLWGAPMLALLVGIGIYLTVKLKFIQRYMLSAIKLSVIKDDSAGMVSNLGSVAVSMAACVGTGNIIGTATAIVAGGPGALFWMIVTGFFGIATKYAECMLGVKYRVKNKNGEIVGGPMYYISKGLKMKKMAVFFCAGTLMLGCATSMMQSNSISDTLLHSFGVPPLFCGIALAALTWLVIAGGVKQIAKVSEFIIPFMVLFYLTGCIIIIVMNFSKIPAAVWTVLESAFNPKSAAGGLLGVGIREAMRFGVSRGVFSNEAGQGSAAIVAAAAKTRNPVRQGLVASSTVFWDTIIICTISGITFVIAGDWAGGLYGGELVAGVFKTIPTFGPIILNISLATFAFTTMVAWYYYVEKAFEFLFGFKFNKYLKLAWIALIFCGTCLTAKLVWTLGDLAVAAMSAPNILALILLRKRIVKLTKKFLPMEIEAAKNM